MNFTIQEELWFGDFSDEEAEKKAADSLSAKLAVISGVHPFPQVAQRLLALSQDPDYKTAEVARLITEDVGLASRVLKLVNSAAFSLSVHCQSVNHAVSLIGGNNIIEIASGLALIQMFDDEAGLLGADLQEHMLSVGVLSRFLALHRGFSSDLVYTCGLFHDLGKLLMLQADEDQRFTAIQAAQGGEADTMYLAEREEYGFDHAVLAGHMLSLWNIPDPVPTVVAWHHQPARSQNGEGHIGTLVNLVRLGDQVSYTLNKTDIDLDERLESLARLPEAVALGYTADELSGIWDDLNVIAAGGAGGKAPQPAARRAAASSCVVCGDEQSAGSCPECGQPLCEAHTPADGQACPRCEQAERELAGQPKPASSGRLMAAVGAGVLGVAVLLVVLFLM